MSGKRGNTFTRRGFTELPFEGVRKAQPSWWAQLQAEMHGAGIQYGLVLAVSKDIVKVFEDDPYMGEAGNGSLTFYAELIEYDPIFCETELIPIWQQALDSATDGKAGVAWYLRGDTAQYVRLPVPGDDKVGWGGKNKDATGSFNPCGGCEVSTACKVELSRDYRR